MSLVQNKPTKSQFTSFIDRIYKKDGKSKQTENRIFSKRLIGECVSVGLVNTMKRCLISKLLFSFKIINTLTADFNLALPLLKEQFTLKSKLYI